MQDGRMYAALPLEDATEPTGLLQCNVSRQAEAAPGHRRRREQEERSPVGRANHRCRESVK